ncbi:MULTISPECIES: branched-chain amino acid ABC transporter permease [Streptomyces]|uniref:Branched-chain amino acid ABC transporter permease n=1 Tax=Streptomyces lonegramiae TaxID=3075524 RepID=A0ABU2XH36_9ACTN|nr:branched-chain amino acid ABC transporter permease [Streptomyces sp. DSM 41529]MDT0544405.1 branched-chain amino acid ABC transporter permease [Streptomyces sp. DSM 41529]
MTTDTNKTTGENTQRGGSPATLRAITAAGGLASVVSTFLAWTWTDEFPGDLTFNGYPGGLQLLTLVLGLATILFALSAMDLRGLRWLTPAGSTQALRLIALGTFATTWFTIIAIAVDLGGVANWEPGAWVAAVASVIPLAALLLPNDTRPLKRPAELPSWAEILIIAAVFAVGLYIVNYGIQTDADNPEPFLGYLIAVGFAAAALFKAGVIARLSALTGEYRSITLIAALVTAVVFPFTQNKASYTELGVNILIFATVALGLNIVVGLAGLLDLGYVAFLGVGAYTAALVSGAGSSTIDLHLPFWAAIVAGAVVSLIFGVLIGAPTLRLRGDYLAIVTLGFGEIFRIVMLNLDGTSGPSVTNGPNGIPNIPALEIFGFNFDEDHTVLGHTLDSNANYFFLMLLVTIVVVLVFSRAGNSRIGRAWVAIREDETAATAMGINGFRVKLIAFALGATLAGVAGTVWAHVQTTVVPEQYVFAGPVPPNSTFLLAAVILGGMGTIGGPLLGATLLFLIPKKLEFFQDYQLLGFGIALILLMRFRPEGIIPNRRQQLEYHEKDQLDAPDQPQLSGNAVGVTKAEA